MPSEQDEALAAVVCVGVAVPSTLPAAVDTHLGKMVLQQCGSGFFMQRAGFVMTCEHVRRACRQKQQQATGARLVVCPYLGEGAPLDLRHAWEVDVLAHSGDRTNRFCPDG